jgi:hypothetical protein
MRHYTNKIEPKKCERYVSYLWIAPLICGDLMTSTFLVLYITKILR